MVQNKFLYLLSVDFNEGTKKTQWIRDEVPFQKLFLLLEVNIGKTLSDISRTNVFLGQSTKAIEKRSKQMGPNQTYKLLQRKP